MTGIRWGFEEDKIPGRQIISIDGSPFLDLRLCGTGQMNIKELFVNGLHKGGTIDSGFIGPAPLVQAFRRIFDSRDEEREERLKQLDYPNGVWACENKFECTRVCPKEIPVTKSINQMKRELKKS